MMPDLRPNLLVDDNRRDLEPALQALHIYQVANETVIAAGDVPALDCLCARRGFARSTMADSAAIMRDLKLP